jgi:hypothetical protein
MNKKLVTASIHYHAILIRSIFLKITTYQATVHTWFVSTVAVRKNPMKLRVLHRTKTSIYIIMHHITEELLFLGTKKIYLQDMPTEGI